MWAKRPLTHNTPASAIIRIHLATRARPTKRDRHDRNPGGTRERISEPE